jgi:hypothetical protein
MVVKVQHPVKLTETFSISKKALLEKYNLINRYFLDCIMALYGENIQSVDLKCFLPCTIIKSAGQNKYSILGEAKKKTGCYIFLNQEQIPVYIGIGGKVANSKQSLYDRIIQELSVYVEKGSNQSTMFTKDSGATLSKNIQEIDSLLTNTQITPDNSVETIKSFSLITIIIGEITCNEAVEKAQALEIILIALFHPKYNK